MPNEQPDVSHFPLLSSRLRDARGRRRWSLTDLAKEAGISKTYLWELENDAEGRKSPSAFVILALSRLLGVSMEDLLGVDPGGPRCESCGQRHDQLTPYKVSGPPGVEFVKLLCFRCSTTGAAVGWTLTPAE